MGGRWRIEGVGVFAVGSIKLDIDCIVREPSV